MRKFIVVGLVAAMAVGAAGFGTVRSKVLGQDAEHERITRKGMNLPGYAMVEPWTMDELAGKDGTFGAVGAPDNPTRGLMSSLRAHCDGGDWYDEKGYPQSKRDAQRHLQSCRTAIMEHMDAAVFDARWLVEKNAQGRWVAKASEMPGKAHACKFEGGADVMKCRILENLGLAFHASQDFYSHTNWVDRPDPSKAISRHNPPGLGRNYPADWIDPAKRPLEFPEGLISGCYEGLSETMNCNYGLFKSRVKHDYLNKDTKNKERAKVFDNFDRAFNTAAQDTYRKWLWFDAQIGVTYTEPGQAAAIRCAMTKDRASSCQ